MAQSCFFKKKKKSTLEKEMATHASILANKMPWTDKPGGLHSIGLQRVRHSWAAEHTHSYLYLLFLSCYFYIWFCFFLICKGVCIVFVVLNQKSGYPWTILFQQQSCLMIYNLLVLFYPQHMGKKKDFILKIYWEYRF